ncbi:MAG TPA: SUMF1/EgtB/PvdO family nonheme iron enzyme [Thermoanaerobaculia bacterium]|jgi:formylglycine-generating enzyme required for sulfatase activity|nr:SUMF1/EgtB/PvdO family nonheme iron enzyme [Thermoanaerobaculia bacterium]
MDVIIVAAGIAGIAGAAILLASTRWDQDKKRPWRVLLFFGGFLVIGALTVIALKCPPRREQPPSSETVSQVPSPSPSVDTAAPSPPKIEVVMKKGVRFTTIPAGVAALGCTAGDQDCADDEVRHELVIAAPMLLMVTEATVAEYKRCAVDGACEAVRRSDSANVYDDRPIRFVTADDASNFCRWVGGRLPTEDEWEYAARGGSYEWRFPWGPDVDKRFCVCDEDGPAPVASRSANAYGLFDVIGNVGEFTTPRETAERVATVFAVRGGSFESDHERLRVSARRIVDRGDVGPGIGIRCIVAGIADHAE